MYSAFETIFHKKIKQLLFPAFSVFVCEMSLFMAYCIKYKPPIICHSKVVTKVDFLENKVKHVGQGQGVRIIACSEIF